MAEQPHISRELSERLDALADRIASAHEFSEEVRRELRSHLEDKAAGYLSGAERLGEADRLLLVENHFGDPVQVRALLQKAHGGGLSKLPAARASAEIVRLLGAVIVVVGVVVWAFCSTGLRTYGWGFSPLTFLVSSIFSLVFLGPFVLAALFGRRIRTVLVCLAIVALVPPLTAEGWASAQERDFVRRTRVTPGKQMFEARWRPFESSWIGTDGAGAYFGGD